MADLGASITDWLQLSQSLSQTEAIWWQVWIAVFMLAVAAVQAYLFVKQLKLMVRLNEMTDLQQRSVFHPELRITNFQIWPKDGVEGGRVAFTAGAEFTIRVHAVNIGGSNAFLCDKEKNCAMAFLHSKEKPLPMFKLWKTESSPARLMKPSEQGYVSSESIAMLAPGDFGFWEFGYRVPENFQDKHLHVLGLVAYWDEDLSGKGARARRRLIAFAKFFSEKDQVFLSPNAEMNPDYNYIE